MTTAKVDFTDVKWTMLVTLNARALDSRTDGSILRDHAAAEAVARIDYDFGKLALQLTTGDRYLIVLRARQLDDWAAGFLARHPDASVIQLGCGLDSRAFRLEVPAGARWYDVDFPETIELRRRLYAERDGYRMIGSSVTEPSWIERIPAGRPTLVIAEGLLMYVPAREVEALLRRLTDRFGCGELLFDGVAPWVAGATRLMAGPFAGFRMRWSIRDGDELESSIPRLRHLETVAPSAQYEKIPVPAFRAMYRLARGIPALTNALRLFRFEF